MTAFRSTRLYWRWRIRLMRWQRALRYATETMSKDDALRVIWDSEAPAGCFALVSLAVEDTLTDAIDIFGEHLGLEGLVAEACERVGSKFESAGHELEAARSWALDLVKEYAARDGLELAEIE